MVADAPASEGAADASEGADVPGSKGAVAASKGAVPASEGAVPASEGAVAASEGAVAASEGAVAASEGAASEGQGPEVACLDVTGQPSAEVTRAAEGQEKQKTLSITRGNGALFTWNDGEQLQRLWSAARVKLEASMLLLRFYLAYLHCFAVDLCVGVEIQVSCIKIWVCRMCW